MMAIAKLFVLHANAKMFRANPVPHVPKELSKDILKRSCLDNVCFKKQDNHSLTTWKKQNIYCSSLYKKEKKVFFNNLNPKFVSDLKLFWKTVTNVVIMPT